MSTSINSFVRAGNDEEQEIKLMNQTAGRLQRAGFDRKGGFLIGRINGRMDSYESESNGDQVHVLSYQDMQDERVLASGKILTIISDDVFRVEKLDRAMIRLHKEHGYSLDSGIASPS
jgi:hypothetical protein